MFRYAPSCSYLFQSVSTSCSIRLQPVQPAPASSDPCRNLVEINETCLYLLGTCSILLHPFNLSCSHLFQSFSNLLNILQLINLFQMAEAYHIWSRFSTIPVPSCLIWFRPAPACFNLFQSVPTCHNFLVHVSTYPNLFHPFSTCPQLFLPVTCLDLFCS